MLVCLINFGFSFYILVYVFQTMLMLGKEELATQCRFLAELHPLVANRMEDNRDTDFIESYLQLIAQLVKNNIVIINTAGIRLESILKFCMHIYSMSSVRYDYFKHLNRINIDFSNSSNNCINLSRSSSFKGSYIFDHDKYSESSRIAPTVNTLFQNRGIANC